MADLPGLIEQRSINPIRDPLAEAGLYHSFRLPDGRLLRGAMTIEYQMLRLESFGLPADLLGKRALDIGPWDGHFTFELERLGAELTAIDYVDLDTFRALHRAFRSNARYLRMDVYELDAGTLGVFDVVLCLGVLYHLKHPLLALEKICAVTRGICVIETFVIDAEAWNQGAASPVPVFEFYERGELGGQLDNWCGPSVSAVVALARAAGFARAEVRGMSGNYATVAAHRHWGHLLPPLEDPPPALRNVTSHLHRGRCFETKKEEYLHLWCAWDLPEAPPLDGVFPEVDGFGIAPLSCTIAEGALQINFRLPPGLESGEHTARVKIGRSSWSEALPFYVDLPNLPDNASLQLISVQDGVTWRSGQLDWLNNGWGTAWVSGLSPEADAGNTVIEVSGVPHSPETVVPNTGQVNFRLRPIVDEGEHEVRALHRGATSDARRILVTGRPPPIRGLEALQRPAP
jgi:tRNA (mo5U34)-methyltransferase